jgi:hypothetical protein
LGVFLFGGGEGFTWWGFDFFDLFLSVGGVWYSLYWGLGSLGGVKNFYV